MTAPAETTHFNYLWNQPQSLPCATTKLGGQLKKVTVQPQTLGNEHKIELCNHKALTSTTNITKPQSLGIHHTLQIQSMVRFTIVASNYKYSSN